MTFKNNVPNGESKRYYKNGELMAHVIFKNGRVIKEIKKPSKLLNKNKKMMIENLTREHLNKKQRVD
jgi:antitoxin component YwqK of YwqJK toxin-antitoxin module